MYLNYSYYNMNSNTNNIYNSTHNYNANEILLYNILHSTHNYITSSNTTINYLNNSLHYLNNSINHLNSNTNNSMFILLQNYSLYNNYLNTNTNTNTNNNNTNNNTNTIQDTDLLNYTLEDFENLSSVNMKALVKICTAKINYSCIAVPLNDTCPITQEEFSRDDYVTLIKNCGHIFKSQAIENWLYQHQTCPICRHNILTNSKIISYINPDTQKKLFLYSNEFRFYLALHIENLLTNRENLHSDSTINDDDVNDDVNNSYEFGLFLR